MKSTLAKLWYLFGARDRSGTLLLLPLLVGGALLEMGGAGVISVFLAVLGDVQTSQSTVLQAVLAGLNTGFELLGAVTYQQRVLYAAIGLVGVFVAKNVYLGIQTYVVARYMLGRTALLANGLLKAYLQAPYAFHLQRNPARLIFIANNESSRVVGEGLMPLMMIVRESLVLLALVAMLTVVEPVVLLLMAVIAVSSFLFLRVVRRRINDLGAEEHHFAGQMVQSASQALGGVKEVKVLGREAFFLDVYARNVAGAHRAARVKAVMFDLPRLFLETIAVVAMPGVALYFILSQGQSGQSVVPILTLLGVAAIRFVPSANRIVNGGVSLRWASSAVNAVYEDLRSLTDAAGPVTSAAESSAPAPSGTIELVNVSFRYEGAKEDAVTDLSLQIPSRAAIGLVGPSGAGKSTTADLILGLLAPTSGQILVNGQDLRGRASSWQRVVGYVPQSIYLSDDTIRRNVAFGIPDAQIDEADVWSAIDAAQLRELIESLPEGLDTFVGDRGIRLSGGQRQRIGIARALYSDPAVLVLDEATSSVDNETERGIVDALARLRGDRTLIIIAHRLTTVEACDRLFFLRGGRLEAAGTYSELFDDNREFRSLAVATA